MNNYVDFLAKFPNGTMATMDKGQPRTRIFQYLWAEDDKMYFCSSTEKQVYIQMKEHAHASFCTWDPATATVLSVDGPVVFVEDKALKARALEENPSIKGIYQSADNPIFALLYIKAESVTSFDFQQGKRSLNP